MDKTCFGCKTAIPGKEYMKCEGCKHKYDLPCAELSPKRFKKLTLDYKRNWKCPECKCKLPKRDNSNTPVRTLPPVETQQPQVDDVTDTEPASATPDVSSCRLGVYSPQPQYVTEGAVRDIWRNEMRQEMETIIEDTIKRTVSSQLKSINCQCSGFQESIAYVSTQYEDLRNEIIDLKKLLNNTTSELSKLREENKNLKDNLGACVTRVRVLEEENLRQQQWVRMQNIEVTGIPEKNGENPIEIVLKTAQCIGVTIQQADVEFAHRVQPRHAASAARARPIVVRLRLRSVKDQIIAAARKRRNLTAGEMGLGAGSVSHTITLLEVPRWVDPRRDATLRCAYARQPRDPPLHSVKWYRAAHEIFRYTPQEFETRAFNSSGVMITNSSCDTSACNITVRAERGAAKYTCEVSSEGPRFAVDRRSANMTLAVLPEYDPLITGLPTLVPVGENALVNCTSDYSLPAATLDWFVDAEPQEDPIITQETHVSSADGDGLRASWRTLHVFPDDYPTHRGYLALRCRATVLTTPPHVRAMSVRLYVAARPHISSYMLSNNNAVASPGSRLHARLFLWSLSALPLLARFLSFLL